MNTKKAYLLAALGGSSWGFSFLATSLMATYGINPIQIQVGRWSVAGIFFLILIIFKKIIIPNNIRNCKNLFIIGLIQPCIAMVFETYGVILTSSSEAALFVAVIPCVALLLEIIVYKKRVKKLHIVSIFLALLGVVICTVFSTNFSSNGNKIGYLLMCGSILSGSIYSCLSASVRKELSPIQITAVMAIMGAIFFNSLNFILDYGTNTYSLLFSDYKIVIGFLFLGIICSAVNYLILNIVIAYIGPSLANNIVSGFGTSVGILAGILIAGDVWGIYTVIGVLFIGVGVLITSKSV